MTTQEKTRQVLDLVQSLIDDSTFYRFDGGSYFCILCRADLGSGQEHAPHCKVIEMSTLLDDIRAETKPTTETMLGPVEYRGTVAPPAYHCSICGAQGVKLWRLYNTFLDHQELTCALCTGKSQNESVAGMNATGQIVCDHGSTCTIGARVPAIPTRDGSTYWGFTSTPSPGVAWWQRLPNGRLE